MFSSALVTDWNRNMPWGVEKLSEKDRQKMEVLAGVDQIGGNNDVYYCNKVYVAQYAQQATSIDPTARKALPPPPPAAPAADK